MTNLIESDYLADAFVQRAEKPRKRPLPHLPPDFEGTKRASFATPGWVVEGRGVDDFPNLHAFQEKVPDYLLSVFWHYLIHSGPESVLSLLKDRQLLTKMRKRFEGGDMDPEGVKYASGRVFERLSYHWLRESHSEPHSFILDPGGTNRLFRVLNTQRLTYSKPDGAMVDITGKTPVLLGLLEYTLNPEVTNFDGQLGKMSGFLSEFKGRILDIRQIELDLPSQLTSSTIKIAKNPLVTLVVPYDRKVPGLSGDITILHAPFDKNFVSELTRRTLKDIII